MARMPHVAAFSSNPPQPPYDTQQPSGYYAYPTQIDPTLQFPGMTTPHHHPHQMAHGRMAMPSSSNLSSTPSHQQQRGPSPFGHDETPYSAHQYPGAPEESPLMMAGNVVSPTDHRDMHPRGQQMIYQHPHPNYRPAPSTRAHPRAQLQRSHTNHVGPPRPNLHRGNSLHMPGPRSASPHMGPDVFNITPRPSTADDSPRRMSDGYMVEQHSGPIHGLLFNSEHQFYQNVQGISPARALGPAPSQHQFFSPHRDTLLITPLGNKSGHITAVHSSAQSITSSVLTASSATSMDDRRSMPLPSDDEAESPTRSSRMPSYTHFDERLISEDIPLILRPPSTQPLITRPPTKSAAGTRTSSKFAKVADDPGVEGVPPGIRCPDRPGPSFACIIGQAILKSKAGGLSLEHIYRYVETAYPYFKSDDGAWRNSVRHNLSIHKMFETIPRTEHHPNGKGGIWIIHEEEKCHWPEDDKFIKNFPASHHHHAVCRQTLHEKVKEDIAMQKARMEGRVYVPKKGKKGRKATAGHVEGPRETSAIPEGKMIFTPKPEIQVLPAHPLMAGLDSKQTLARRRSSSSLPLTSPAEAPISQEEKLARGGAMAPPTFGMRKRVVDDEDSVFTVQKKVRLIPPLPMGPIAYHDNVDDSFITPERPMPTSRATNSAFKTPALVNTSSSPGSSPLPTTITRSMHHPSGLQQGWTNADVLDEITSSPARQMLDPAFQLQPKPKAQPTRMLPPPPHDDAENYPSTHMHGPPKTPVSRSSAVNKTPRANLIRTPFMYGSPAQAPPSASADMSTPMWTIGGCLARLGDIEDSPTQPHGAPKGTRSPVPPTSPTRYAMLLNSGSPRKEDGPAKDLTSL